MAHVHILQRGLLVSTPIWLTSLHSLDLGLCTSAPRKKKEGGFRLEMNKLSRVYKIFNSVAR